MPEFFARLRARDVELRVPAKMTDDALAVDLCGALAGDLLYVSQFGWKYWTGHHWDDATQDAELVVVADAFNAWAAPWLAKARETWARSDAARQRGDAQAAVDLSKEASEYAENATKYRKLCSKRKVADVSVMMRARLCRDARSLDAHPDLLAVANGVVDLRTGALLANSPDLLLTKSAPCAYDPAASSVDWDDALLALDPAVRAWAQDRFGQAVTGHMTPDDRVVFCHGGGSNGKSTLFAGLKSALGPLLTGVSEKVLTGANEHLTTLMTLQGVRLAFLEELPDSCSVLPTGRIKALAGTEYIKARRMRQDEVEFRATHSLFVTLNNRPAVTDADDGTWRRLCVMPFPYSYRAESDCTSPSDRVRDDTLRDRLSADGSLEAALAWVVAGAIAWYARGKRMLPLPPEVIAATEDWRLDSDQCKAFADEMLVLDPNCWIPAVDLTFMFAWWQGNRGSTRWGHRTFQARFNNHSAFRGKISYHEGRPPSVLGVISRRDAVALSKRDKDSDANDGALPELAQRPSAYVGVAFRSGPDDHDSDKQPVAWVQEDWPCEEPDDE